MGAETERSATESLEKILTKNKERFLGSEKVMVFPWPIQDLRTKFSGALSEIPKNRVLNVANLNISGIDDSWRRDDIYDLVTGILAVEGYSFLGNEIGADGVKKSARNYGCEDHNLLVDVIRPRSHDYTEIYVGAWKPPEEP